MLMVKTSNHVLVVNMAEFDDDLEGDEESECSVLCCTVRVHSVRAGEQLGDTAYECVSVKRCSHHLASVRRPCPKGPYIRRSNWEPKRPHELEHGSLSLPSQTTKKQN